MKKIFLFLVLSFLFNTNFYSKGTGDYPGGFCYTGFGGAAYDGLGGPCYDGLGGDAYSGLGGPCYKTSNGFAGDCPKACRCKACKK